MDEKPEPEQKTSLAKRAWETLGLIIFIAMALMWILWFYTLVSEPAGSQQAPIAVANETTNLSYTKETVEEQDPNCTVSENITPLSTTISCLSRSDC